MRQIVWVALSLLVSVSAHAASFDCAKVATKMEKLICGDQQLSKSDEELAAAYSKALKEAADPAAIKKQQREWLADVRKRCDDVDCLKRVYGGRIISVAMFRTKQDQSRIDAQKIMTGEIQKLDGISYRTISALDGHVTSIELLGEGDKYAFINKKLRNGLRDAIGGFFACQASLDEMTSENGLAKEDSQYSQWIRIVSFNGRWITLSDSVNSTCGGPHPITDGTIYTLDTSNGEKLDLLKWLKSEKKNDYFYSPSEKLNGLILRQAIYQSNKNHPGDHECQDLLVSYDDGYKLALGKTGIVFSTYFSHSAAACDEDVEIPYAKLQPFFTKEGKEAAKAMMDSAPSKK